MRHTVASSDTPRRRALASALLTLALAGCATTGAQRHTLVPTRYQTEVGPYSIHTNFPLSENSGAIQSLQALETQVQDKLAVRVPPDAGSIEVYILDSKASFSHFLRVYYPELPPRRAFFFAQGDRRVVYTFQGSKLDEDLRHEGTHALLHTAVHNVPLWLDEGLAEYFEVPRTQQGLNAEHVSLLEADLRSGWTPNLGRLEQITDLRAMAPRDYREAWAWVHFLLNGSPSNRTMLLEYLDELRTGPGSARLVTRLESQGVDLNREMQLHLASFLSTGPATLARSQERPRTEAGTTRLQSEELSQGRAVFLAGPPRGSVGTQLLSNLRRLRWWR